MSYRRKEHKLPVNRGVNSSHACRLIFYLKSKDALSRFTETLHTRRCIIVFYGEHLTDVKYIGYHPSVMIFAANATPVGRDKELIDIIDLPAHLHRQLSLPQQWNRLTSQPIRLGVGSGRVAR